MSAFGDKVIEEAIEQCDRAKDLLNVALGEIAVIPCIPPASVIRQQRMVAALTDITQAMIAFQASLQTTLERLQQYFETENEVRMGRDV